MSGSALTSDVVRGVARAWQLADADPDAAFTAARKAAEAVCLQLYIDTVEITAMHPSLDDMIGKLTRAQTIPQRLVLPLKTIQSQGAFADTSGDVRATLTALDEVVRWYFTAYLKESVPAEIATLATTPTPAHVASTARFEDGLPAAFAARPTTVLATKQFVYVGSDTGEWAASNGGELLSLPATGPFASAVVDGAVVVVACWGPAVKRLHDATTWHDAALGATPLALAPTARGVVAGDADGGLALLPATSSRIAVQDLTAAEPVADLLATSEALVVLGVRGALEVTAWPHRDGAPLVRVDTRAIGRAVALHAGARDKAYVVGTTGYALLATAGVAASELGASPYRSGVTEPHLVAVASAAASIRGIVAFRGDDRALVFADTGDAWIASARLTRAAAIDLPGGVVGAAAIDGLGMLAWTGAGELHHVSADGTSRRLATERDVVLATPDPTATAGGFIAVHWSAARGMRLSRGRAA